MKTAESNGTFDYDPNLDLSTLIAKAFNDSTVISNNVTQNERTIPPQLSTINTNSTTADTASAVPPKRKNSLDDFELDIDGINLDDTIDTSVR